MQRQLAMFYLDDIHYFTLCLVIRTSADVKSSVERNGRKPVDPPSRLPLRRRRDNFQAFDWSVLSNTFLSLVENVEGPVSASN